jgi:7-cyano-7-deazaguanine synthase
VKVLVLLSGGLDSMACLTYYKPRASVSALFVDYGQLARTRELKAAKAVAGHFGIGLRTLRLSQSERWGGYIPARNALLLTLALMHFKEDAGLVSIGIHAGTSYADCAPDFIRTMQSVFDTYTGGTIRIDAPFVDWRKGDIWQLLKKRRAPIQLTYSCELGRKQPCGKCQTCHDLERLGVDAR